jgi:hypothetical protein
LGDYFDRVGFASIRQSRDSEWPSARIGLCSPKRRTKCHAIKLEEPVGRHDELSANALRFDAASATARGQGRFCGWQRDAFAIESSHVRAVEGRVLRRYGKHVRVEDLHGKAAFAQLYGAPSFFKAPRKMPVSRAVYQAAQVRWRALERNETPSIPRTTQSKWMDAERAWRAELRANNWPREVDARNRKAAKLAQALREKEREDDAKRVWARLEQPARRDHAIEGSRRSSEPHDVQDFSVASRQRDGAAGNRLPLLGSNVRNASKKARSTTASTLSRLSSKVHRTHRFSSFRTDRSAMRKNGLASRIRNGRKW